MHINELKDEAARLIAEMEASLDKPRRSAKDELSYKQNDLRLADLQRQIEGRNLDDLQVRAGIENGSLPIGDAVELKPEQRMADYVTRTEGPSEKLSFAKVIRGLITGSWKDADSEKRAMAEGTNSAGGYTVPAPLSAELIDLARNKTQVIRAGATTVPMTSQTLKYARLATDVVAAWRNENAQITP